VGPALLPLVQLICNQRYLPAELLLGWTQEEDAQQLLEQLVAKGFLLMERQDE